MGEESIAIIGSGQMGLGIAEACARAEIPVVLVRGREGDPSAVGQKLGKRFAKLVERGKLSATEAAKILDHIRLSPSFDAIAECEIVIETALEDMEAKSVLLPKLEAMISPGAILATNTSSLPLLDLAETLKRPEQFLALHFFNPATVMELVELGITEKTAPGVIESASRFCKSIGKTPVEVCASPGYVVNRLLVPYLLHAVETLQSGIASADAIDQAMKLGCNHPIGPLSLADLIGLDVVVAMAETLGQELEDARYRTPKLLRALVDAGELGRKTGSGIFDYTSRPAQANAKVHQLFAA